jgi:hypothetical protein
MRRHILAVSLFALLAGPAVAAIPASQAPQVAAVVSRHDDGSEYVWRVFCSSGLRYAFIPASDFPQSSRFEEVASPRTGDIAWWPEYVAIFVSQNQSLITQAGMIKLADLASDGNRPHFYRMRVLANEDPSVKPAEGECTKSML